MTACGRDESRALFGREWEWYSGVTAAETDEGGPGARPINQ